MVLFGCYIGRQDLEYMDAPITIADTTSRALLTVVELAFTPSMCKAVQRVISSAPALESMESMPCFIQSELVELVQLECERAVALISDDAWLQLSHFFSSPVVAVREFLSSKAAHVMEGFASFLSSSGKETMEDMEEWLRPWSSEHHHAADGFSVEVPWDYYLLKARRCDVGAPLTKFSDLSDFELTVRKMKLALTLYKLFQRYSQQVLQPCLLPSPS
ncbi:hypothetical protein STCU_11246 [Strigomonas culicis]|uniref:Uncharacterized protein n=1 Tax=Strigomonas culicis TaxID=28005 RepID=S9TJ94_9TRYP|nr:hypothetical protein STCU_11246 [Strigomonas culicis]|eukprot:EPY16453.1 hypothetical protein STCU_11246 [Strigomonas culicis]